MQKKIKPAFQPVCSCFDSQEYVWLFSAFVRLGSRTQLHPCWGFVCCQELLATSYCTHLWLWHCLLVKRCILRMKLLKLNLKYHLRYFKIGLIHDNQMNLENSTAHDKLGTWGCHKKTAKWWWSLWNVRKVQQIEVNAKCIAQSVGAKWCDTRAVVFSPLCSYSSYSSHL